jgi:regulatory protein
VKLHPESSRMFRRNEEVERAKTYAYRLLNSRAYTHQEIVQKLKGQRFSIDAIKETMETLKRLGLVDDAEYAKRWVAERLKNRPMGRMMMERELHQKGIAEGLVDLALDEMLAGVDFEELALDLLRGRLDRYRNIEKSKAVSRMYGFLGRRGFHRSICTAACEQAWEEIQTS